MKFHIDCNKKIITPSQITVLKRLSPYKIPLKLLQLQEGYFH